MARRRSENQKMADRMGDYLDKEENHRPMFDTDMPEGFVSVTVILRFNGGESQRTLVMSQERLLPEVIAFFDPISPNDGLLAN